MPWIVTHRARLADDKAQAHHADTFLDCDHCKRTTTDRDRAGALCYWSSARERKNAVNPRPFMPPRWQEEDPEICPGACMQMPQVLETARAYSWRKDGALREFYDGKPITWLAKYCIDLYAAECVAAQNDAIRARQEK